MQIGLWFNMKCFFFKLNTAISFEVVATITRETEDLGIFETPALGAVLSNAEKKKNCRFCSSMNNSKLIAIMYVMIEKHY